MEPWSSYGQMNTPRARMFVMTTRAAASERATATPALLAGAASSRSVGGLHHRAPALDSLSTRPPPPPPTSKEFMINFRIFMKNTRPRHYSHDGCLTVNVTYSAAAARVGARAIDRRCCQKRESKSQLRGRNEQRWRKEERDENLDMTPAKNERPRVGWVHGNRHLSRRPSVTGNARDA